MKDFLLTFKMLAFPMPWNRPQYFLFSNFVKMHCRLEKKVASLPRWYFPRSNFVKSVFLKKKMDCVDFFYFFPHRKKFKRKKFRFARIVQLASSRYKSMWRVKFEAKILIPNIIMPPFQIRTLSEKLYITQKNPPWMIWNLRAGPTLTVFSLLLQKLFWSSSFCDTYWDFYRPKRTKLMPPA